MSITALLRPLFVSIVVLGLLVRAAIPMGYMLDRAEGADTLTVRLCNGGLEGTYAALNMKSGQWIVLPGGEAPGHDKDAPSAPTQDAASCDFALSMVPDLPQADIFDFKTIFGLPLLAGRVFIAETYTRVVRAPLPARGPPTLI